MKSTGQATTAACREGRPPIDTPVAEVARLEQRLAAGDDAIGAEQIPMLTRYFRASAGYMAYCGTFRVEGEQVIHRIENSLFPEWIGSDRVRTFAISHDTLRLSGDAGGLIQHLFWQRALRQPPCSN